MNKKQWSRLMGPAMYTLILFAGFQSVEAHSEGVEGMQVVKLGEMSQESLMEYFSGINGNVVLECSEGMNLPFNLNLYGDFLRIESEEYKDSIRVLKTCYMRFVDNNFIFSLDLQSWHEFSEFFSGVFSVGIDTNEGTPKIGVNIELNQKQ